MIPQMKGIWFVYFLIEIDFLKRSFDKHMNQSKFVIRVQVKFVARKSCRKYGKFGRN